jgi:hypothetical protein
MEGVVVIGAVLTGGLVLVGYGIAMLLSGRSDSDGTITTTPIAAPQNCADFCAAWQSSRSAVCRAQRELAAAQSMYNTVVTMFAAATAAYTAALAAAVAATYIPFIGPVIAAALFSAAFTLLAAVVTLLGVMAGFAAAVLDRKGDLSGANNAEQEARTQMLSHCTAAEAQTCLATPPPC